MIPLPSLRRVTLAVTGAALIAGSGAAAFAMNAPLPVRDAAPMGEAEEVGTLGVLALLAAVVATAVVVATDGDEEPVSP